MSEDALPIALALIRHPSEALYLIALREDDAHQGGLWEFPGGKCLPGEAPAACVVREAQEETGLRVTVLDAWPALPFEYPERRVLLHPFLCRADRADARPLESRQVRWVAPADLPQYPFPPANAPLLARLQAAIPVAPRPEIAPRPPVLGEQDRPPPPVLGEAEGASEGAA